MSDEKKPAAKEKSAPLSINDLLEMASKENETRRAVERTTGEIPVQKAEVPESTDAPEDVATVAETAQEALRRSVAEQIGSDKEIASYLKGTTSKLDNEKIEEIYGLLNNDDENTVQNKPTQRLSTLEEAPKQEKYEQELLFSTGDLDAITPDEKKNVADVEQDDLAKTRTAVFDEDYDSLSEKIESGELSMIVDENDDDQIKLGLADTRQITVPPECRDISSADAKLRIALGLINKNEAPEELRYIDEESEEATAKARKREERKKKHTAQAKPEYEYTSSEQDDEVVSILEKSVRKNTIKLIITLVLAIAIGILEINVAANSLVPDLLKPGRYGLLYICVDIQLLLFVAIALLENIVAGARGLFSLAPTPDSVLFCSIVVPFLHAVMTALVAPNDANIHLFCLAGAVAGVVAMISKISQFKRDIRTFEVISTPGDKFTAAPLSADAKEANEFYKYLLKDSDLYTVQQTRFIDGFFSRICKRPKSDDLLGFQIPLVLLAAVIAGIAAYLTGSDLYGALTAAAALCAASFPISSFLVTVFPVNAANKIARSRKSALIGNAVADEYDNASVLSFSDAEVFPSKNVKITGFRTYGDFRIDKIIVSTAKLFSQLGGPLADVFSRAMPGAEPDIQLFRLIDVSADGFIASMDGHDYYVGKRSFMRKNRFDMRKEPSDDEFEENCGSVMYVSIDDELAAKIYIKYKASAAFNALLRDMYTAGMCIGIKTLDPNISNELLQKCITFTKCPIAILKADTRDEIVGVSERVSSGIVTLSGMHTFLKMFILADKTRHSVRTNAVINFVSVFLSFAVVFFLIATGSVGSLSSGYAMLFQLLWLLPISALSFLM